MPENGRRVTMKKFMKPKLKMKIKVDHDEDLGVYYLICCLYQMIRMLQ